MRVCILKTARKTNGIHQPVDPLVYFSIAVAKLANTDRLCNNIADAHAGVQGRERILKDDLHLLADREHLPCIIGCDVLPIIQNLAACRFNQAQDGTPQR